VMKILFVTSTEVGLKNAAGTRLNKILPLLSEQLIVKVISLPVLVKNDAKGLATHRIFMSIRWLLSGWTYSFLRYQNKKVRSAVLQELSAFQPDVVHFDGFLSLSVEQHVHTVKKIYHVHDSYSKKYDGWIKSEGNIFRKLKLLIDRPRARKIEKLKFSGGTKVIVDSKNDQDFYRKRGFNAHYLPLGFDRKQYFFKELNRTLYHPNIMLTGSMSSIQTLEGIDFFIKEVYPIIAEEMRDVYVYFVGSNPSVKLKEWSSAHKNFIVTGYVEDLNSYLNQCDVYLFAGRIGSGMKTRTLEALAAGCPVVSTKQGVIGLEDCIDFVYVSDDPKSLAFQIINSIKQKNISQRTKQAHFIGQRYSWRSMSDGLINHYYNE
jgi:polysaccharide biosynthesis protein PslH